MLAGHIFQIFQGLQTIDGLKSNRCSPSISFLLPAGFALSDIFFKVSYGFQVY